MALLWSFGELQLVVRYKHQAPREQKSDEVLMAHSPIAFTFSLLPYFHSP
jgi:hypothetical protein